MRFITLSIAMLASLPAALAQSNLTSTSLSCYTQLATFKPSTVSTFFVAVITSTRDISQTITYTPVATITPNATTFTSVLTTTATYNTTVTSQLPAVTVPTRAGFVPFAETTGNVAKSKNRHSRIELARRQGDATGAAGFELDGNGVSNPISTLSFPFKVYCEAYVYVAVISTSTVTASTAYTTVAAPVITAYTTTTTTVTSTITNIAPARTIFATCGLNNVVSELNGRGIFKVEYQPASTSRASASSTRHRAPTVAPLACRRLTARVPFTTKTSAVSRFPKCRSITGRMGQRWSIVLMALIRRDWAGVQTRETLPADTGYTIINGYCGSFYYSGDVWS
ncbi:uncharacterized protein BDZ99DRAFT_274990 [Mytilinidion resinicola]|uniref:Uncharacterized protein n=1 Tax=Mytilinidion resinicola TaxID=574789 RepID=A0A6A6YR71_9PEZI|nr:uncharacterized protein BDZ99DRAFT_274990 [Mytilinidion resinicola]KAF2811416.1 hypothetical protein BDZ99DRAFT_274990 [Mytilinidion resinicola]